MGSSLVGFEIETAGYNRQPILHTSAAPSLFHRELTLPEQQFLCPRENCHEPEMNLIFLEKATVTLREKDIMTASK